MTIWCPWEPTEDYPETIFIVRENHEISLKSELMKKLKNEKLVLIDYLQTKIENGDWHGVSDCANDLREVETKLEMLINLNDAPIV